MCRAVSLTPGSADIAVKRFFCRSWAEECCVKHELRLQSEASGLEACVACHGAYAAPVYPAGVDFFICMT